MNEDLLDNMNCNLTYYLAPLSDLHSTMYEQWSLQFTQTLWLPNWLGGKHLVSKVTF